MGAPMASSKKNKEEEKSLITESIEHWRLLAATERKKLLWDKTLLPSIAESRARLYENTAKALELELKTGVTHCACHLITTTACQERVQKKNK